MSLFPTIFLHSNNPIESFPCLPIFSHSPPSTNGEDVGEGVGTGVGVVVGVGVGVGLGEGVGDAVGFGGATVTPLFQTSFLLLLMQVYFFPAYVEVAPSFVQELPAFTTADASS